MRKLNPDQIGRGLGLYRLREERRRNDEWLKLNSEDQRILHEVDTVIDGILEVKNSQSRLLNVDFARCGVNTSTLEEDPALLVDIFVLETSDDDRERFLKHLNDCYVCSSIFAEILRSCHRSYSDYCEKTKFHHRLPTRSHPQTNGSN